MLGLPIVLKFGSSVLLSEAELPRVASEIYRYVRQGRPVLAVVSAFDGHTDQLIQACVNSGIGPHDPEYASSVSLGEVRSAHALRAWIEQIGLSCDVVLPEDIELQAEGRNDHAIPVSVKADAVRSALRRHAVTIVPGFSAVGANGRTVLLGRGGSDMTAIYLAYALDLGTVRLIKDVDGLYTSDPNRDPNALRYSEIEWDTAREIGGVLVQSDAVAFAANHSVEIEVARIGQVRATRIGARSSPPQPAPTRRPLRIVLAGCGTVGGGVAERLLAETDRYELVGVLVNHCENHRDQPYADCLLGDASQIARLVPDVLIEATNGTDARHVIARALDHHIHVISANKQAVAHDLDALLQSANDNGVRLRYSACVGGAAPIVEMIDCLSEEYAVERIESVLNGTINYIGSRIAEGHRPAEAIRAAQDAGFAEADVSADLAGKDALAKARILARHVYGKMPTQERGMEVAAGDVAQQMVESAEVPKQLATIARSGAFVSIDVSLRTHGVHSFLERLEDEFCGAVIYLDTDRRVFVSARGAGRIPTTESILGDLGEIERLLTQSGALDMKAQGGEA